MNIDALNDITYGMYVISTKYNNKNIGCFVNTVSQITAENPIISVSINKNNYTAEALKLNAEFGISILSEETNPKVIGNFGFFSSRNTDKFSDFNYEEINNIPIIKEKTCGYLICKVINIIDSETHNIVLARVLDAKKEEDLIPMTYSYYHKVIKGKTPKTAPTYKEAKQESNNSEKYKCMICGYIYDDSVEKVKFADLPDDWKCPICGVGKDMFKKIEE